MESLPLGVVEALRAQWSPCIDRRRNHHVLDESQMEANAAGQARV